MIDQLPILTLQKDEDGRWEADSPALGWDGSGPTPLAAVVDLLSTFERWKAPHGETVRFTFENLQSSGYRWVATSTALNRFASGNTQLDAVSLLLTYYAKDPR